MNCERRVKALDHCGLHFQLLVPEQLYSTANWLGTVRLPLSGMVGYHGHPLPFD